MAEFVEIGADIWTLQRLNGRERRRRRPRPIKDPIDSMRTK
ncbi:hypothetical protein [Bradyrhizobium sp. USDA 4454]